MYKMITNVFPKHVQFKIITTIIIIDNDRYYYILYYFLSLYGLPYVTITNLFEYEEKLRESLFSSPWLPAELISTTVN